MKTLKVLIADNHPAFRSGLRSLLESMVLELVNIEVVDEVENSGELLGKLNATDSDIDLIFLDLNMTNTEGRPAEMELDGITVLKNIRSSGSLKDTKVVVVSMYDEDWLIENMKQLGADGFLSKHVTGTEYTRAIEAVCSGGKYFPGKLSPRANSVVNAYVSAIKEGSKPQGIVLSNREKEVLKYLALGLTNKEIAEELFLSPKTVDNHRMSLFEKFDVNRVAGLITKAFTTGHLKIDD